MNETRVAASARKITLSGYTVAVAAAIVLGFLVRLSFVLASDFPLNDGGLFYVMVHDLQQAGYRLPEVTSYNFAGIPFAYPPLGPYLAALLNGLLHVDLLDVLRFLPTLVNVLTIGAFFVLARSLLQSRVATVAATFAFALLPSSFLRMIMGGGLTRALGGLFAILAIYEAFLMHRTGEKKHVALAALFSGCTILSHPDFAWFAAYSIALFFMAYGRNRRGVVQSALVVVGALLVACPWWLAAVLRQGGGAANVLANVQWLSPEGVLGLLLGILTEEPYFPLIGALAVLGAAVCLARKRFLLPAWLASIFVLQSRGLFMKTPAPVALLAGIAVAEVVLPLLSGRRFEQANSEGEALSAMSKRRRWLVGGAASFGLAFALISASNAAPALLSGLPLQERQAMQWVAGNTPASSTFLVLTAQPWPSDPESEWFPALANRTSVATVQGYEWLPGFSERVERSAMLQKCAAKCADCLDAWSTTYGIPFTHVYVVKKLEDGAKGPFDSDVCEALQTSLRSDPAYALLYDGAGASVYQRVQP